MVTLAGITRISESNLSAVLPSKGSLGVPFPSFVWGRGEIQIWEFGRTVTAENKEGVLKKQMSPAKMIVFPQNSCMRLP
jgi:hypothetical protein